MNRKYIFLLKGYFTVKILIGFFTVLFFFSCSENDSKIKPNIILILTDDQGWGDLSINRNTNISTPNIDKLATEGVTFDRFYVCPVCSPTRAELLTGRYHIRGGIYSTSEGGERLDLDETTFANLFKKAGYKTAAYGKWHNGTQAPYHPNARGFDDFYGFCSGHWGNYFSPMLDHNGEIVKGEGFIIDDLTNHGIRFIEKNKDNPFFLYLPYNTPHTPMQVPDKWWDKYKDKELKLLHKDAEKEEPQFTKAALAMCENIDWNVGRIMSKINELGIEENTIVIYLSDNGPNSWRWNGGMKGRKGSTDEGGVRSPMFIKWGDKFDAGKKVEEIAGAIDLLPTLTDLAGIENVETKPLDGVSLKPLLVDGGKGWQERYIFNNWRKNTSVRSQRYRLDAHNNLYDMVRDSGQNNDVSKQFPEIAAQMIKAKEKWEVEVLSELPEKDERSLIVGYPGFPTTQLPARDGVGHGNIKRSNRWPNCSFFTNWISENDSITWDVEVVESGNFEVDIYYTCPLKDIGSTFEFSFKGDKLIGKIELAHDPPLTGMKKDRFPRENSYVKDFKKMEVGQIYLNKGKGELTLKALDVPGDQVMEFRQLILKRIEGKK